LTVSGRKSKVVTSGAEEVMGTLAWRLPGGTCRRWNRTWYGLCVIDEKID